MWDILGRACTLYHIYAVKLNSVLTTYVALSILFLKIRHLTYHDPWDNQKFNNWHMQSNLNIIFKLLNNFYVSLVHIYVDWEMGKRALEAKLFWISWVLCNLSVLPAVYEFFYAASIALLFGKLPSFAVKWSSLLENIHHFHVNDSTYLADNFIWEFPYWHLEHAI